MRDVLILAIDILAFAGGVTLHLSLVVGLSRHVHRMRALVALILPPYAPYWGLRHGMPARSIAFLLSVLVYIADRSLF